MRMGCHPSLIMFVAVDKGTDLTKKTKKEEREREREREREFT
jgi:hypothetical protein